jgi:hypothetical protein
MPLSRTSDNFHASAQRNLEMRSALDGTGLKQVIRPCTNFVQFPERFGDRLRIVVHLAEPHRLIEKLTSGGVEPPNVGDGLFRNLTEVIEMRDDDWSFGRIEDPLEQRQ